MKRLLKQEGQSAIIIAGGLFVLVALIALVVDAGNAYVQRRRVQNALDSGAQVGAIMLAQNKTNGQIYNAINDYVNKNGVDPTRVKSYYVVEQSPGNNVVVRNKTIDKYGLNYPPQPIDIGTGPLPVAGVQVEGDMQFPTFFAGVVGWKQMQVGSGAAGYAKCGACSATNLFPIALDVRTFADSNGDGTPDIYYEQTSPTYVYTIWENKQTSPGNFGYLHWASQGPDAQTLADNMNDPSRSGRWSVGDNVPGATGTMNSSQVRAALDSYISSGNMITVPVYDTTSGNGSNTTYHIVGFARFKITSRNSQGSDKNIQGKMEQWLDAQAEGGCASFGVCTAKVRPPIDTKRALVGTIKLDKITVTQTHPQNVHVPVDVVNLLDISYSMRWPFAGCCAENNEKLNAAKTALKNFNLNMQPAKGDQLGLVVFPKSTSGKSYTKVCSGGSMSTYMWGDMRSDLGTNVAGINSTITGLSANDNTPAAGGLLVARQTVLGAAHKSGNVAVIVMASDGLANVRVGTGQYTGGPDMSACNQPAVQDATDQAMIAKSDANHDGQPDTIIFTIAIGSDFDPSALKSIASTDTDPSKPHFFKATDTASMANIYQQISDRVQQIGSETCQVIHTDAFAGGATINVKNNQTGKTYALQTTSTGDFVLNNADEGTYEFTSATVTMNGYTYNVFTQGVGGAALGSNPTVDVLTGSGTYSTDLFLKTTQSPACPN